MVSSTGLFRGLHLGGRSWEAPDWSDTLRVDPQSWLESALSHLSEHRGWSRIVETESAESTSACGETNFRPIGALSDLGQEAREIFLRKDLG